MAYYKYELSDLMLVFNVIEKQDIDSTNQFVIYNVNKATAVDLFYGGKNIFIANESLIDDLDKLLFHVKHNWFYRSGSEHAYQTIPLDSNLRLINFQNRIFFRMDSTVTNNFPNADLVLVENIDFIDNRVVDSFIEQGVMVVIGTRVAYSLKNYLIRKMPSFNLHVLKTEGAFEVSF